MVTTLAHTILQGLTRAWFPPVKLSTKTPAPSPLLQVRQIQLIPGEMVQLDIGESRLRVLSGRIWVAQVGRERILYTGEELWIGHDQQPAALWTLMRQPAVVEQRKLS